MNILLLCSGTKKHGATERAAFEIQNMLTKNKIDFEFVSIGNSVIASCSDCGACKSRGRCIYDDEAQKIADIAENFDAFIFLTPVHYGGASGNMISMLSRLFRLNKGAFVRKPAAAVAVSRRGGNFTAIEEITRFLAFASMPIISGNYPAVIYGTSWDEVECDKEGLKTLRTLTENIIWILRSIDMGRKSGINPPET